jgi:hypothetical protein
VPFSVAVARLVLKVYRYLPPPSAASVPFDAPVPLDSRLPCTALVPSGLGQSLPGRSEPVTVSIR